MTNTTVRYSPIQRHLHWLMALLVMAAYLAIEQRGVFERGSPGRFAMMQSHFWLGLTLFALIWWRLTQRLRHGAPPITPPVPDWQSVIAKAMHMAFYAFFMIMPVLGLATAWTDGKVLFLPFTDIALPPGLAENEELAHTLEDIHAQIGDLFYWVIGAHVLAAAHHHFVRRDDTLKRMT